MASSSLRVTEECASVSRAFREKLSPRAACDDAIVAERPIPASAPASDVQRWSTTWTQEGLWLLDQISPDSREHRTVVSYRISGPFSPALLRATWEVVVARHEALRTTISEVAGRLVQVIGNPDRRSFSFVDLTLLDPAERDAKADELCELAAAEPIDLAAGPLARLTVLRVAPAEHRAVLVVHLAVADDHSVRLLLRDLSTYYDHAQLRRPALPPKPPPAVHYADFANRQRALNGTARGEAQLRWWSAALTPLPERVVLPWEPDASGGTLPFDWGSRTSQRLAALCHAEDVEPQTVLLAAVQAALARYGALDRVAIGVPVSLRTPEFADVVGQFDNLLVIVADLTGAPTFRELVGRVARVLADGTQRRSLPFARLAGALASDRAADQLPLVNVLFDARGRAGDELMLPDATVRGSRASTGLSTVDLAVTVSRVATSVGGTLAYRGGAAARRSATMVLDQLRTLLLAGLATPDVPVADLPAENADQVRTAVTAADRIAGGPVPEAPVHELVVRRAAAAPDDGAVDGVARMSYAELTAAARSVAAHLTGLGAAGRPVAIRMPHGATQLSASVGALLAGAHLVWFGSGETGERARIVLAEQRPVCLLVAGDPDTDDLARWYRDELDGQVLDATTLDAAPAAGSVPSGQHETCYVAYTSGSTGRPKGIAQTHGAFAQFVTWMGDELGMGTGTRVAQWVAADHDPSLCEVFATLVTGGTLCPVPEPVRVHPERFVDWLVAERITFLQTVPSFARELLGVLRTTRDADLLALDTLVLMGEALAGELAAGLRATLPGTRLVNMYGPTETIAATWHDVIDAPARAAVPIGESIPGRQVLVLDDADRPCQPGVTGEIVIRSPYVAAGYVGDVAGGAAFTPVAGLDDDVRTYRTGDLARRRWDGVLEFRGRRDLQVKVQGNRLELAEVEAALAAHSSVAECAVVPRLDGDGLVRQLIAYVVPRDAAEGGASVWRTHLRARFGRQLVVQFEVMAESLPRNVAGKVDRRRLPPPRVRAEAARSPATTPAERAVAELWTELTGAGEAARDESFFSAGGHSLLIPLLRHRIRERFGVDIPVRDLFVNPTIAAMSAQLEPGTHDGGTTTRHGRLPQPQFDKPMEDKR